MKSSEIDPFVALLKNQHDELLAAWRTQVRALPAARNLDIPTINDQVPELLDDLTKELSRPERSVDDEVDAISAEHGLLRWQAGFDVTEVVAEYNILRQCVLDLTEQHGIIVSGERARVLHKLFDEAAGRAIKAFETMMTIELKHRHEEHIAFVLHDMRTPLNATMLALSVLEREMELRTIGSPEASALRVIRGNVQRLDERVRSVLAGEIGLGQSFEPQFAINNLREEVETVIADLAPVADASGTVVRNEVPSDIEVYTDQRLLAQVIQNLMSNALKFTPRGNVVIGAIKSAADRSVECWVKDTGEGVAADKLGRIFERFETDARPERRGLGLGLAIVKEIIELHRGDIRVESRVGEGTTFTFTIPVRSE